MTRADKYLGDRLPICTLSTSDAILWTHKSIFSYTDDFRTSFLKVHTPTEKPFNASLRDSLAVIYSSHHRDDEGFAPWFSPNADCSPTLPTDLCNPDPDAHWQV